MSKIQLNEKQMQAVTQTSGHVRIIAGAGSGKTRVITSRIEYLISQIGILPYRILAITFTNKAANEMKERLLQSVSDDSSGVNVSTIHSFCVRFLREEIKTVGYPRNFTIVDADDQKSILKEAYKLLDIDVKHYSYGNVLNYISACKGADINPEVAKSIANEYTSEGTKAKVYEYYELRLNKMYALDFDDLLLFTRRILKAESDIRKKWQNRFDYLHVDEFQDVDKVQYDIVKFLVGPHAFLCVVGDPDQTIYTWRGADVNIIMHFEKDFVPCTTIVLNENYRSSPAILNGANSLIQNNQDRIEKDLFTALPFTQKIMHYSAVEENLEPLWVALEIKKCIADGMKYRDIAVLYRSNYLSRSLETKFLEANIPYRIYGGVRFYDRAEIKDALCYLRMLIHDNAAIDLALKRIINVPKRGIGSKSMESLEVLSRTENVNLYEASKQFDGLRGKAKTNLNELIELIEKYRGMVNVMGISMLLEALLEESGYIHFLEEDKEIERIENLKELITDIRSFEERYPEGTLDEYLQQIALYTDKELEESGQFVQLMTIHASKGLEFDAVFVYEMVEGVFPNERAVAEGGRKALEEERRLAYVAFTRARKRLYISDALGYSFVLDAVKRPSRFIHEIEDENIEHVGKEKKEYEPKMIESKMPTSKPSSLRLRKGDLVSHASFGDGVIIDIDDGKWTIAFGIKYGTRKISANHPSITKK